MVIGLMTLEFVLKFVVMDSTTVITSAMMGTCLMEMDDLVLEKLSLGISVT
jgi:type III secretory pathway component EscS